MTETFSTSAQQSKARSIFPRWWSQIAAILLVIVELCWILPWFQMVTQITETASLWVVGLVLGGVMLTTYLMGMAMEQLRLRRNVQLVILSALLILSISIAENELLFTAIDKVASGLVQLDPGAILVLFFVIWMWWRGVTLSRGHIRPMVAWRRFELGLLFFMAYIFIAARLGFSLPGIGVFMLFLFSGLLAVVFARVSYVGITRGIQKNPFDLRWSLSVGGILGGVVIFAALAGGLLTGQYRLLLDFLGEAIKLGAAVIIFILGIPGLLVSYILGPILPWLRSHFTAPLATTSPEYPAGSAYPAFNFPDQAPNLPLFFQTICFWGLILVVVMVLILRIRKSLRSHLVQNLDDPESLLQEGEARKLLKKAFQDTLDGIAARLRPAQRLIAAARIRRIYAQLLDLCAELNQPRMPHQTPGEFLPEMGELFSANPDELIRITQAYQRVRYGELPEDKEEMEAIEVAWKILQENGQRLKRAGIGKLKTVEADEVVRSGT